MNFTSVDFENARLISRILKMYYHENMNQAQIGHSLGLSTAKVNRLVKLARQQGMVEISLHPPFQHLFDLEHELEAATGLSQVIVVPNLSENPSTNLNSVSLAAANFLLKKVAPGDVICMGGGKTLSLVVQSVQNQELKDVTVVPAVGGIQGRHYTDVNNLAAELASRLGGTSYQLYSQAIADTIEERDTLLNSRHVKEVLDLARNANIAVVGIGNISLDQSDYLKFTSLSQEEINQVVQQEGGVGEILARVFDDCGGACSTLFDQRVVGIELEDLKRIPISIGIAALPEKVVAISAALRGGWLNTLITDEATAIEVLRIFSTAPD